MSLLVVAGCKKHVAAVKPTPPAPAAVAEAPRPAPAEPRRAERPAPTPTPTPVVAEQSHKKSLSELLAELQDAYFDFDKFNLRPDAQSALTQDSKELSQILRDNAALRLAIEGYCDERGSAEYNLALGDKRARQSVEFLASMGIPKDQLKPISYGKERPVCTDENEGCWQKNRHSHVAQGQ